MTAKCDPASQSLYPCTYTCVLRDMLPGPSLSLIAADDVQCNGRDDDVSGCSGSAAGYHECVADRTGGFPAGPSAGHHAWCVVVLFRTFLVHSLTMLPPTKHRAAPLL